MALNKVLLEVLLSMERVVSIKPSPSVTRRARRTWMNKSSSLRGSMDMMVVEGQVLKRPQQTQISNQKQKMYAFITMTVFKLCR
jgi:hypothetical protein